MIKKLGVIITLLAIVALLPNLAYGEGETTDDFINYRSSLISYQPEFTVEGSKMIIRQQAVNNTKAELDKEFFICSSEELKNRWLETGEIYYNCGATPNEFTTQHFEKGGFDWYIWHQQIYEYSRFAQVKTRVAKFPINEDVSQRSYAIFSYQGYWAPTNTKISEDKIIVDFYSLVLRSGEHGPDYTQTVMFLNPDVDYPLFFTSFVTSRYGFGSTSFYTDGENIIRTQRGYNGGGPTISYKRSLNNGQSLDYSDLTVEDVQEYEHVIF